MPLNRLSASLILCNVPTTNSKAALEFYATLLGLEVDDFARGQNPDVESYFVPLSNDGIDLTVTQRFDDQERLTCYFAVDDLDATLASLPSGAVKVVAPPRAVTVSPNAERAFTAMATERPGFRRFNNTLGRMAVVLDPDGNHVGLMELQDVAKPHFRVGRFAIPLTPERIAVHDEARRRGAEI